jgi:hypothetical protein
MSNDEKLKIEEIKKEDEKEINTNKINIDNTIPQTGNKSIDIYIDKINYYMKLYSSTEKLTDSMIQLFKKICEPFFSKISNSFLNEIKPLLKYFKEISSIYANLSNEMKKLNHNENEKNLENQNENLLFGDDSNNIVHKTNSMLDDNFKTISNEVKKVISSNSNFSKIDTVYNKFDSNFKKMISLNSELEMKRQEYVNLYTKNYDKQFSLFKSQIKSPDLFTVIQDFTDYILIEHNLISSTNQMFININHFLNEMNVYIKNSKTLLNEYVELLRQLMQIYHNQITIIFNENLYKTFGNYEKFVDNSTKLIIDGKLSVSKLLENNTTENTIKDFNNIFSQLQEILLKSNFIFNTKDIIDDENNFKAEKYYSLEELLNFLLKLIPKTFEINYNDLIQYKVKCKRSRGMFKGFKNAFIVVTIQGHVLIFDENKENNEINFDKSPIIYNKSKVGSRKKKSKKSNFMIVIWEYGNNKKKNKSLSIDTLNNDNFNDAIKNIGGFVDNGKDDEKEDEEEDEDKEKDKEKEKDNNEEKKSDE